MEVNEIVEKCKAIYDDLSFPYARQWKERTGGKVVAFMPVYVPRELIHAAGMLPVGVMGGGNEVEIIRGDAYFQSYICRIPRSTIELGVSGRLDFVDGFLFPPICDVIRNLSGMWKILFPKVFVKYLDLPQNFNESGRHFYKRELEHLRADFEKLSGRKITDEALNNSIRLYNENRRAIEKLYSLRSEVPYKVLTYELYLLQRAGLVMEVSEHTQMLHDYMAAVLQVDRPYRDNIRVVVSGAFCEQPPLALIRALEGSGCYIVDDDWVLGTRYQLGDVPPSKDALDSIVDAYFKNTVATASRFEDGHDKGKYLIAQVKQRNAQGVIFAAPSFCDPALLESPMLVEALDAANIAHTSFKYAENTGQIQVIKEQTGTFADSIKLWGTRA